MAKFDLEKLKTKIESLIKEKEDEEEKFRDFVTQSGEEINDLGFDINILTGKNKAISNDMKEIGYTEKKIKSMSTKITKKLDEKRAEMKIKVDVHNAKINEYKNKLQQLEGRIMQLEELNTFIVVDNPEEKKD